MLEWISSVYNSTPVDVRTLNFWYVICYIISLKMARFGNSNGLSVKRSFLEPKCGQKSQIWPPCDQIALANWIIYMNLHFKQRKIFACGGNRATILSVSQLLSVKFKMAYYELWRASTFYWFYHGKKKSYNQTKSPKNVGLNAHTIDLKGPIAVSFRI